MVLATLDDWTLDALLKLLASGAFESDSLDFKEQLPDPRNEMSKQRLSAHCAAFANASGGFLVFGVKDDRALKPEERLVGVEARDFPNQFGEYPLKCSPSVEWQFRSIPLPSGTFIQVVQIPTSWRAPHNIEPQPGTFRFPKRTNKGTEHMPISEVRSMFLGLQEKRRKVEMLRAELAFLGDLVQRIKPTNVDSSETSTIAPPVEVLQALVGETYVLLEKESKLVDALNEVRRRALDVKEEHARFHRELSLAHLQGPPQVQHVTRNHNARLETSCEYLARAITTAQEHLKTLLA